ncbi:MAG: UDP-N-acetylmuramoyl-L-alanyl-D-glutamate--2,6-diaminopimelate ligase [Methylococcales bacterium]|nr:UDP-N-acetylmuramoyl-L-alanyl-D-glutamate--2,6-diaminopimelate ligase [Methylococcales bacterium]
MNINDLLRDIAQTMPDTDVTGLTLDSRKVCVGDAFFALPGAVQHGLGYVRQAVAGGVVAVIYDPAGWGYPELPEGIVSVAVPDLRRHLGVIAARFYDDPSSGLAVIGVTGTNGKTTCTQLIAQILPACGVIGTLGWGGSDELSATLNTTPDALAVQNMLRLFADQGKQAVAMEVSSHGLQQGRVNAVQFKGAVFTNLSRDHLDYHADMNAYLQAKLALFTSPALQFAVINLDDPSGQTVLDTLAGGVQAWTFSSQGRQCAGAECLLAENIRHGDEGIFFDVIRGDLKMNAYTPLAGGFNLENVLAVLAVLLAMDTPFSVAVAQLARLKAVTGRMEKFGGQDKPTVFVDYAHSPDALEKALKVSRGKGRLWVVFGCGGDRDKGKRAEMGRIAGMLADEVIVTEDNPRTEPSAQIIDDILAGCNRPKTKVIVDRAAAIKAAIRQAARQDCVVIAGKGHENYQEVNGVRQPFSDQHFVKQSLTTWGEPA